MIDGFIIFILVFMVLIIRNHWQVILFISGYFLIKIFTFGKYPEMSFQNAYHSIQEIYFKLIGILFWGVLLVYIFNL
jgi:hypothetical protein